MYTTGHTLKVAFGNKARVGKDTACDYYKSCFGGSVIRLAAGVYECGSAIQKVLGKEVVKDGSLLQLIGEGMRNVYNNDIWLDAAVDKIKELDDGTHNFYIPDMRYKNEADRFKSLGFTLVKINRQDRPVDRDTGHPSEVDLDDYEFDYIINNDGTQEEFMEKLSQLYKKITIDSPPS